MGSGDSWIGCACFLACAAVATLIAGIVTLPMGLVQQRDAEALSHLEDFESLGAVCVVNSLQLCAENVERSESCGKNCQRSVTHCEFKRTFFFTAPGETFRSGPISLQTQVDTYDDGSYSCPASIVGCRDLRVGCTAPNAETVVPDEATERWKDVTPWTGYHHPCPGAPNPVGKSVACWRATRTFKSVEKTIYKCGNAPCVKIVVRPAIQAMLCPTCTVHQTRSLTRFSTPRPRQDPEMEIEKALEAARGLYIAGSVLLGIGLPLSCCMFIVTVVIGKKYIKRRTRVVGVSQGPAAGNSQQIVQAVAVDVNSDLAASRMANGPLHGPGSAAQIPLAQPVA